MADYTYSTSTPNAQLSEEQRRRRYMEKMLREFDGPIDSQTQREIENKVRTAPIQQVDQELQYTPDEKQYGRTESMNAGQAGIEQAQAQLSAQQKLGQDPNSPSPVQQQIFDLLDKTNRGEITPQQYAEQFQALTGVKVPGGDAEANARRERQQLEKQHADELKRRYGRAVSDQYVKSIKAAKESGLYADDFKDNLFGAGAFNGARARSRRGWTKEDYANEYRMLNREVDQFEQVRQQLTENFQRLDPFAKTQYNEMSKQIQGLERAKANGQIRPIEYLRAMGQLADRSQQIKWKHHMRQPGQSPGEISNQNGMMMQMTNEGPKPIGLLPDYIKKNTFQGEDGNIYVPKLSKGEITYEIAEDKNHDRIPDAMQMKELAKEFEDKVNEHAAERQKAWMESNPLQEPSTAQYKKWRNEARAFVSEQEGFNSNAMKALYGDNEQAKQGVQQHIDAVREEVEGEIQQEVSQEAQQAGQMMLEDQKQQEEAVVQEATAQLMDKYGMDEPKARQTALDDLYAQTKANPAEALKARQSYDYNAKKQERGVDENMVLAYQSMLKKAKTVKEQDKIKAENWERDPLLSMLADNPIVWTEGTKRRPGEVYLMRRGDEYLRVWHKGKGKNIILRTPEEREAERMKRIEGDKQRVKKTESRNRLREAEKAAAQYQGRF